MTIKLTNRLIGGCLVVLMTCAMGTVKGQGKVKHSEFTVPKKGDVGFRKASPAAIKAKDLMVYDSLMNSLVNPADYTSVPVPSVTDSTTADSLAKFIPTPVLTQLPKDKQPSEEELYDDGYRGYLRLGYGNYQAPFGAFYYRSRLRKKANIGLYAYHHSAWTGPVDAQNSAFSTTNAKLYGTAPSESGEWSYQLGYSHLLSHWYGYADTTQVENIDRDSIRQVYHLGSVAVGYQTKADNKVRWDLGLKGQSTQDRYDASEYAVLLDIAPTIQLGEVVDFKLAVGGVISQYEHGATAQERNLGTAGIGLRIRKGILDASLGGRLAYNPNAFEVGASLDSAASKTYLYPDVEIKLYAFKKKLALVLAGKGGLERNSLRGLVMQNAWIESDQLVVAHTDRVYDAGLGLEIQLGKWGMIKGNGFQKQQRNTPLFVNLANDQSRFGVRYESEMTITGGNLNFILMSNNGWRAELRGSLFSYQNLQTEAEAWHLPQYTANFDVSKNFNDKLYASFGYLFMGGINALDPVAGSAVLLDDIHDLRLKLDYQVWEKASLYVEANNLLSMQYSRYFAYPLQEFNIRAGFTFRF